MNDILRNKAHLRSVAWASEYSRFALAPGGWLVAVTAQIDKSPGSAWLEGFNRDEPLHFEVTEPNGQPLYGGFDIDHRRGYDQGGIAFDEPLPNVNAEMPYILVCESHPRLIIYTLNCWHG